MQKKKAKLRAVRKLKQIINDVFYNKYVKTMNQTDRLTLNYDNLTQVMQYEAVKMITGLSNHLDAHFNTMLNRIVNIEADRADVENFIRHSKVKKNSRKKWIAEYRSELRRVKNDILFDEEKADPTYDNVKQSIRELIIE
jgi:hypothetical protein